VGSVQQTVGGDASSASYGYDSAGDTTSRPGETIAYDAEGKVQSVTATGGEVQSNVYDAQGNLLLQSDTTSGSTLFLGDTELHEAAGSTTASALRTYCVGSTPVAERSTVAGTSGSSLTWTGADSQGTVNLEVTPTTGSISARYFDPFGQNLQSSTGWSDDRGFLNASTSTLSGLVQLGARAYDPSIGRFLSVDSVLAPLNPQQNNGYSYSHNSPVDLSDPTGLDPHAEDCSGGCHYDTYDGITRSVAGYGPNTVNGKVPPAGKDTSKYAMLHSLAYNAAEGTLGFLTRNSNWLPGGQAVMNQEGVTTDVDGALRTEPDAIQLRGGYGKPVDDAFALGAPNTPERFRFTYNHKKYVIWAWKGQYLN
jgi:RHS repeat-associated protein